MTAPALVPTMTSSWTYPPTSPGLWFNSTNASANGEVRVGGALSSSIPPLISASTC